MLVSFSDELYIDLTSTNINCKQEVTRRNLSKEQYSVKTTGDVHVNVIKAYL